MDFDFSENQRLLYDTGRAFLEKACKPNMNEWLERGEFPRDFLRALGELGWMGAAVPKGLKGEGLSELELGVISELFGYYEVPVGIFLTLHLAKQLVHLKDEGLRASLLERLIRGELVICGGYTEPHCGSDASAIKTKGRKEGGRVVIDGEKCFISSPGFADAYILTVRTEPGKRPQEAISLVLVQKGEEGLEPYELKTMASEFKGDFGGVRLAQVSVPEGAVIGEPGKGFGLLMREFGTIRVHVALLGAGLARRCLDEAIPYAKERLAFGVPISKFEAVSFRLAEAWSRIEAARLTAYRALWAADQGRPFQAESSLAKWYGCELALKSISDALQTAGAAGYTADFMFERAYRRARGLLIGDGTSDIQKLIIARSLFGKEYV